MSVREVIFFSERDNVMKIIMLGAPGAGKGTQAKMIAEKYSIPHVSTGDIFRANIKNGTDLGKEAKSYMDKGELVPDELTVRILLDRVAQEDCKNGYVLDGFPRTIPQAEVLQSELNKQGTDVDFAINVDVPDENIIKRMSGRRACVTCGATYHIEHVPPKTEGICDVCGEKLIVRDDDKADYFCPNSECAARNVEALIHFASKDAMNIDLPHLTHSHDGKLETSYIIRGLTATQLKNAKICLERDGGYKAAWGTLN